MWAQVSADERAAHWFEQIDHSSVPVHLWTMRIHAPALELLEAAHLPDEKLSDTEVFGLVIAVKADELRAFALRSNLLFKALTSRTEDCRILPEPA